MSERDSSSNDSREQGLEFGELEERLEDHEYPVNGEEIIAEYGEYEIEMANSTRTVEELLSPVKSQTYDSAEAVRQSIFNMVGSEAEGRTEYSDRGGSAQSAGDEDSDQQSF